MGEIFNITSEVILQNWQFTSEVSTVGNISLNIASWYFDFITNSSISPDLYTSAPIHLNGNNYSILDFNNINLKLTPGKYVAYLANDNLINPVSYISLALSYETGGIGVNAALRCESCGFPNQIGGWSQIPSFNLQYSATFDTLPISEVHLPSSIVLFISGLIFFGVLRKTQRS